MHSCHATSHDKICILSLQHIFVVNIRFSLYVSMPCMPTKVRRTQKAGLSVRTFGAHFYTVQTAKHRPQKHVDNVQVNVRRAYDILVRGQINLHGEDVPHDPRTK